MNYDPMNQCYWHRGVRIELIDTYQFKTMQECIEWAETHGPGAKEVAPVRELTGGRTETAGTEHLAPKEQTQMTQNSTNPKDRFGRMKPDLTSIPAAALIHEARAMQDGARKYGPYNWRTKTVATRVYLAAAMRHLVAFLDGEEEAADSGIHHLGHARASLGILLDAQANGTLVDDRPAKGAASRLLDQFTQQQSPDYRTRGETAAETGDVTWHTLQPRTRRSGYIQHADLAGPGTRDVTVITEHDAGDEHQKNRKPRGYIAGPMRGCPKFNFPAFDAARDLAVSKGLSPISPADMDRESGFQETDVAHTTTFGAAQNREFANRDTAALLSLRAEDGDFIALLPGWEKSTGAVAEFFLARWLGLKVLNATTMEPFDRLDLNVLRLSPILRNTRKTLGDPNSEKTQEIYG